MPVRALSDFSWGIIRVDRGKSRLYHLPASSVKGAPSLPAHLKMANILEQIESKYPVEQITVNGEQVWPYLRIRYQFAYRAREAGQYGEAVKHPRLPRGNRSGPGLPSVRDTTSNLRYGLGNWFRTYDYLVLSYGSYRRPVDGKLFNRFLDPIVDALRPAKALWIEEAPPYPPHSTNELYTRYVVSGRLLTLFGVPRLWLRRWLSRRYNIAGNWILDRIGSDFALDVDAHSLIAQFEARRSVFARLFRIMRPRALLLTCYYDVNTCCAIRAAKNLGIKVVEVQHGVIGKEHPAYNVHRDIDTSCFPDYLLVFGRRELATFDNHRLIDPANVHPVGSFYLDHIRNTYKPDPQFFEHLSGYEKVVGVTLQLISEKRLIAFISEAARIDDTILYLLIPRRPENEAYASMDLPANVTVIRDKSFYELMAYCDFHSTVDSTCALEAPALGMQNVLVDINGMARAYYGGMLTDDRLTRFAGTPEDYVDTIRSFARLDRDAVCKLHEGFFATNYRENIREFVNRYL